MSRRSRYDVTAIAALIVGAAIAFLNWLDLWGCGCITPFFLGGFSPAPEVAVHLRRYNRRTTRSTMPVVRVASVLQLFFNQSCECV